MTREPVGDPQVGDRPLAPSGAPAGAGPAPARDPSKPGTPWDGGEIAAGLESLKEVTREIEGKDDHLVRRFEARLGQDATKDEAFRRLYQDLEDARRAASAEETRPLLLDLLLLYDRMSAPLDGEGRLPLPTDPTAARSFVDELLEILYRRDVHPLVTVGGRLDAGIQRVVGVVAASSPDDHLQVERVVRQGFRWGERLLRAEDVIVRQHPRPRRDAPQQDGQARGTAPPDRD